VLDGELRLKYEVYELGLQALRLGDEGLGEAEKYFNALVDGAPEFAEGFFQAARVAERKQAQDRARSLMAEAVRLLPTHDIYVNELRRMAGLVGSAPAHGLA
jgi:hypothetical protein